MSKRSYLTLEQKAEILTQKNGKNLSPSQISHNTGIARTTIISFLDKYDKEKTLTNKQGRPKKATDEVRQQIVQLVTQNLLQHVRDHAASVPVGRETVRKIMHEEHFDYYSLTPISPLNDQHIINRLQYCDSVLLNGIQPIIFTDESTVVVDPSKHGIWRQRGFHPQISFYEKDHHPLHVMVCVCGGGA